MAETGSLEALGGVGGCHVCEGHHYWNKGIHESGYRSRKELREGIRQVDMQEIESGLLNSQFGVFIKVWIRHLGLMRLSDVGLAGPLLISVDLCCGREWQTADKAAIFGWLKAQTLRWDP